MAFRKLWIILILSSLCTWVSAQHEAAAPQPDATEAHAEHATEAHEAGEAGSHAQHEADGPCGRSVHVEEEFNAGDNAVHHITDANAIHIVGDLYFNLPCILYAPKHGFKFTTTAAFEAKHHGIGEVAQDRYVLIHGNVMRATDESGFPMGTVTVDDYTTRDSIVNGKDKTLYYAVVGGQCYPLESKTTWDGGIMGGGITSYYDFSITRNVFTMLFTGLLLFFLFRAAAVAATRNTGQAPRGLQNFLEPFVTFIRDEVAKPSIGPKYEKYMPYLLSAFFFILGLNLIGQVPFFPGSGNVTGNISVTFTLAILTFLISTFSAKRHFWEHTLWMPGVPALLKIFILTPIEVLGIFLKPFTLLLRLFANITAGHIVVLSFVSLIFIFGNAGQSVGGSVAGAASIPLTLFMMTLELLVAFLQAFIFVMLSATYIGSAIEEPHHH
ncbi:MAG: F0F1 ATP synthase subunit A [Lewinellaceae bacterium]|nr:F0F1 ATP synthase subunit A [Lewinellaceae bacterium]